MSKSHEPAKTAQLEKWTSDFGDEYAERNAFEEWRMIPGTEAFRRMMSGREVDSVLEVGCSSVGLNLIFINALFDGRVTRHTKTELERQVAEYRRTEEALARRTAELEEARNFLDSVLEHLPVMLFVKDAEHLRFVRWNRTEEEALGIDRSAAIGKSDYDFFPEEQARFFEAKDRAVLTGGQMVDIPEEAIQTAHRGLRFLHTIKVPVLGADGTPKYLVGISEDITDRKRAQEELARAREQEVEIGFKIQQTLLLEQPPQDLPGVRAAALTIPSQRIDGDFYDFFNHRDTCLDVIVGDVMGKGIPAALLGAATKSHFLQALSRLISLSPPGRAPRAEGHRDARPRRGGATADRARELRHAVLCPVRSRGTPPRAGRLRPHDHHPLSGRRPRRAACCRARTCRSASARAKSSSRCR